MGEHLFVRGNTAPGAGEHERALEPAAVLVCSLQVHIAGGVQLGVLLQHGYVGATGVNPYVERVLALFEVGGQAEFFAQLGIRKLKPNVGAVLCHKVCHLVDNFSGEHRFVILIKEDGQRHTPSTLARDTPVRAGLYGAVNAVAAPSGQPLSLIDLL